MLAGEIAKYAIAQVVPTSTLSAAVTKTEQTQFLDLSISCWSYKSACFPKHIW
jgi:hypothetical protein